ncbi:MAG: ABC-2 type transport system ATP-binding protein [Myxococcota bacterium]|jgi:ABC-2 type transport system ATP-binding protein
MSTAAHTPLVQVQQLTRTFGAVQAVDDLSFEFDRGQIFGFIGPNGAGKTTTMRILAGLDEPTHGNCLVDGHSTVDDADLIVGRVGYMPDNYGAYPNTTVEEYLDFFGRAYQLSGDKRRRVLADVIEFCQLGGLKNKLVTTLSKGMKQRLCLGRTLLHDPDVLVLDEPSAGLDPRARIEFRELTKVLAEQGKAILVSSHILADLEEMCDAVAIIELGRLVATGNVRDIKQQVRSAREAHRHAAGESVVMEIRLSRPVNDVRVMLAQEPDVTDLDVRGDALTLRFAPDPSAQAALLKRLIDRGLPVCHFATRDENLEDLFMHLTEGRVQ